MRHRLWFPGFVFCVTVALADIRIELIDRSVVLNRLRSCPAKDLDRQEQLRTYFADAGCKGPSLTLDPDQRRHSKFGNVVCTLQADSPEKILVGAHFDHAEVGSGAVDNWSGASFLPSLYQSMAAIPRKHTFVFIGFFGEERGLVGSRQYVRNLGREELASIDAMVNLDTFVVGPTEIWAGHADPILEKYAFAIASAMKLPLQTVKIENVSTDSETFREKHVPSIEFCSLTQSTWHLLHSVHDQVSAINEGDYYNTYHLLSAYLAYLDQVVQTRAKGSANTRATAH